MSYILEKKHWGVKDCAEITNVIHFSQICPTSTLSTQSYWAFLGHFRNGHQICPTKCDQICPKIHFLAFWYCCHKIGNVHFQQSA